MARPGRPFVRALSAELDAAGLEPVVIRRATIAGAGGWDSDVDIAVRRDCLDRAREVLEGLVCRGGGRVLLEYRTPGSRHAVVQPAGEVPSTFVLPIHLQDGVRENGAMLMPSRALQRARRNVDGLWRPAPDIEAAALLLHLLAGKGHVPGEDRAEILGLCEDPKRLRPWCEPFDVNPEWALEVDKERPGRIRTTWARRIRRRAALHRPITYVANRLGTALGYVRRFVRRRGALIAFVGPDGAGKSTLIEEIDRFLRASAIPVHHAYFGVRGALLPTKRWLRAAHVARRAAQGDSERPSAPVRSQLGRLAVFLGTCHSLVDQWLRWAVNVRPALARARFVLADRYLYDAVAAPAPFGLDVVLGRLVCSLAPRPDLVVVLTDDAERIHARKPELTVEEIRRQMSRYRSLIAGPAPCRVVEGGTSAAERATALLPHVFDAYARRNG